MADYVLLAARILGALLAGVFFAYAVSVMPALGAMDDDTFVKVMNKVNVVIVNPVFLAVFLGAPWHRWGCWSGNAIPGRWPARCSRW